MLNKMPIRMRLTAISVLLLALCCVGLTVILNLSAGRMADVIEATPVTPALTTEAAMTATAMTALEPSVGSQVARSQFQYQSIIYLALVIIAGGLLIYYMTGKALKPLQELSDQMKNRTVHNLLDELDVPQSHDEIAALTISFNQMSHKLGEAFAMQKRFSQSAAHELRTPLTVLKTKVEVFKKKKEHTPGEYDKLLSVMTTHTDRLSELVKDLLDLANMDTLDCDEQIELKALVSEVARELSSFSDEKRITVTVEGVTKEIAGNRGLLHRAFYNLVENAIKYNIECGTVRIAVENAGDRGRVCVCDTGIGVPVELLELIFEPFFRVDKSRSRQMGGAGLGLATVRAIIEMHSGTVQASANSNGGTDFEVIL